MKTPHAALTALLLAALAACKTAPTEERTAEAQGPPAFNVAGMDTTVKPCDDFDTFVNGTWKKNNPVPPTESRWGGFVILNKENLEVKCKGIIDELLAKKEAKKGSDEQLIADMYRSFMDTATVEQLGATPLKPYFDKVDAVKSMNEYAALAGSWQKYGVSLFFGSFAEADIRNSRMNVLYTAQDGLSLGERSYYEKTDAEMVRVRDEFVKHVDAMFGLAGLPEKEPGKMLLAFETGLAKLQLPIDETRDPSIFKKIATADLLKLSAKFDMGLYMKEAHLTADSLLLQDRSYVSKASDYIGTAPMATLKTWLKWKLLSTYAGSLNKAIDQENFRFYGTVMSGTKQQRSRADRALRETNDVLGEPLGKLYAAKYFPASSRTRVEDMIEVMRSVYGERIQQLAWMSPETKKKAMEKLAAFTYKIGYPDTWKDYSMVEVTPTTLVQNTMNLSAWASNDNLKRIGKEVDKKEWGMTPQTVNAYYNPSNNEIVFPAGILQPPFFNANADDAINYGAIMSVIGHELTHGFDDQGAKFDAQGNLVNWWTPQDSANFSVLTNKLVDYFDAFEALPGVHVKGKLTLGENIADLGGVTIAYHALERSMKDKPEPALIDGYDWRHRFFLGYGQIWCMNQTPEALRNQVETNPHSPSRFRVNGSLGQLKEFADVWCKDAHGTMIVSDSARVVIW
ncbi:MAG TPA: M13 family metallopeptidase [Flavobacteriales bacterium]|nr:M13 family metallopeptidase [Flavobacteriales bacterium]